MRNYQNITSATQNGALHLNPHTNPTRRNFTFSRPLLLAMQQFEHFVYNHRLEFSQAQRVDIESLHPDFVSHLNTLLAHPEMMIP